MVFLDGVLNDVVIVSEQETIRNNTVCEHGFELAASRRSRLTREAILRKPYEPHQRGTIVPDPPRCSTGVLTADAFAVTMAIRAKKAGICRD
jgi:hypothetical protein